MPINPNAPKTTTPAATPATKPVVHKGNPHELTNPANKELQQQQQTQDQFVQANPLSNFKAAPSSVQVSIASTAVASNSIDQLKKEEQIKNAKNADTKDARKAPPTASQPSLIASRFEITKRAFQGAAEMLVGDRLHKGFELLSKMELTPKQQQTFQLATSASAAGYRTGLLAYIGSQVSQKILEKNSNNTEIDSDVLAAAMKIADEFMGSV